jgi:hypothetical protein
MPLSIIAFVATVFNSGVWLFNYEYGNEIVEFWKR